MTTHGTMRALTQNIHKVTKALNVDLFTYVIENKEADDIYRATFLAGIPEWDASSDLAFVQVLRSTAAKYGIRYILEGHSFQVEGFLHCITIILMESMSHRFTRNSASGLCKHSRI